GKTEGPHELESRHVGDRDTCREGVLKAIVGETGTPANPVRSANPVWSLTRGHGAKALRRRDALPKGFAGEKLCEGTTFRGRESTGHRNHRSRFHSGEYAFRGYRF